MSKAPSFPNVQRFKRTLKNGSVIDYAYHRPTKRRLRLPYGSAEFIADYRAAEAGRPAPELRDPEMTFVYAIRAEGLGLIKIGKARHPERRFADLKIACPDQLALVGYLCDPTGGTLERKLHARFAVHRVRGEWFRPDASILAWIETEAVWLDRADAYRAAKGLTLNRAPPSDATSA